MGDPGGIGPEVIVKALYTAEINQYCTPVIIGDRTVLEEASSLCRLYTKIRAISSPSESDPSPGTIEVIETGTAKDLPRGRATAESGHACVHYIRTAVALAMKGEVDGIVTAPISKEALKLAGYAWPGHTEMIAEFTGAKEYGMLLVGGLLRVILVTIHTSLRSVPDLITQENVLKTIRLAGKACDMMGIQNPKIAVAGLNPHAGESGIFGSEEEKAVRPAVEAAAAEGFPVEGPFPPDTIFHKAYRGDLDIVVCMYHDQGLIPLKMIAFDEGVNITVGLPIIRTSPDHGTAYDIAWKGKAQASSMIEAIKLASRLKI